MFRPANIFVCLTALLVVTGIARAQESRAQESRAQASRGQDPTNAGSDPAAESKLTESQFSAGQGEVDVQELVDRLVTDLGAPDFGTRQKAARQILELDATAVSSLEEKIASGPSAISAQLQALVPRLRKRHFDDRLMALKEQPTVAGAVGLPEWDRFSSIAGEEALPVYLELLEAEPDLFAARLFAAPDFASRLRVRSEAFARQCSGSEDQEFPIASCAALMLLGSDPNLSLQGSTSTNISAALRNNRFKRLLRDGVHSETLIEILGAWIVRPNISVDQPLLFAMEFELKAGRQVALQTLARPAQHPRTSYSLLCMGALNLQEDVQIVERLLSSSRKAWPAGNMPVTEFVQGRKVESTYSVQIRDIALAVAIHLRGQRHADFGMQVMHSDVSLFRIESMGFDNEEVREAAFAKYREMYSVSAQ